MNKAHDKSGGRWCRSVRGNSAASAYRSPLLYECTYWKFSKERRRLIATHNTPDDLQNASDSDCRRVVQCFRLLPLLDFGAYSGAVTELSGMSSATAQNIPELTHSDVCVYLCRRPGIHSTNCSVCLALRQLGKERLAISR